MQRGVEASEPQASVPQALAAEQAEGTDRDEERTGSRETSWRHHTNDLVARGARRWAQLVSD